MVEFTVLVLLVIVWLADRATLRRRLDDIERELREHRRPLMPSTPRVPEMKAPTASPPALPPVLRDPPPRSSPPLPPLPLPPLPAAEPGVAAPGSAWGHRVWELVSGGNLIVRGGVLILFFGVGFLLRYAAQHSHLTIEDRLIGVALAALVLLGLGWRWRSSRRHYALALQGAGVGVLYLTVFTALHSYALLSALCAFALLAVIGAFSALLAILQDSMAFAVLAAVGGYLAPILASGAEVDHVTLLCYFALLNLAVVAIAWFRSWRVLNLVAFLFTYVVGTAWGVLRYRPENFSSTEPFLILFFLMFVGIALLFGSARSQARQDYVDGTLVFGTPVATMALQAGMLRGIPFALAYSALALSAFYLLLAWAINRRKHIAVRLLLESFIALSVAFATLAIPFAFDGRWTAATWALEGAAIFWIGLRQDRRLGVLAGMALQAAAALAYFNDPGAIRIEHSGFVIANNRYLSQLMLSIGALVCAARLRKPGPTWFEPWRMLAGGILFLWGIACWLHAGTLEVMRDVSVDYWPHGWLALAALSAALMSLLAGRLDWVAARYCALWLWPVLAWFAIAEGSQSHPFAQAGGWIWPAAFVVGYLTLRRDESILASQTRTWLHSLTLWLLCALTTLELAWQTTQFVRSSVTWSDAVCGLVPALMLMMAVAGSRRAHWPFAHQQRAYAVSGPMGIGIYLLAWGLYFDAASDGTATPLAYLPLLNPMDLSQGIAIVALIYAMYHARSIVRIGSVVHLIVTLAAFAWLNAMVLRTLHHYAGVAYTVPSFIGSTLTQTCLTIFWTVLALAAMVWSNHAARRVAWIAGAALLGVVIAKLFLVDLSRTGSVPRIVSFLGVGILMLVIGYYSPLPPRTETATV
jgi:uncharacterized membrane protein